MTCSSHPAYRPVLAVFLVLALSTGSLGAQDKPLRQIVDAEIQAVWQREKIAPAPLAEEPVFLRRIFLDLVGTIPTYEEATKFLKDTDPKKREKLIDRLLADPRYAGHQADVWDLVLFGRNPPNSYATRQREVFQEWLTAQFAKNEPYDRWVRELLLAQQDGPALYYVQYQNHPEESAVAVSRVFLGTQLQCARCHDHPFESWTQRDFYGLAAFFARLVVVDGGSVKSGKGMRRRYFVGEKNTGEVLFSGPASEQKPGKKGEPIKPKFLSGELLPEPPLPKGFKEERPQNGKVPPKPLFSRKEKLAAWLTGPGNPYFTRAVVNRLWGQFLGRGLAHPVDDLTDKRPASHPRLLEAMTRAMAGHKHDMKWLIRELVNSRTYQLAAIGKSTDAAPRWFERARVRPLSAEELLASWRVATGFDDAERAAGKKPEQVKLGGDFYEYVRMYFGEPNNGQGDFQGSLAEHLFLNNSDHIRRLTHPRKGNLADSLMNAKESSAAKIDRLFLTVLSRPPRPAERERLAAHLASDPKKLGPLAEEAVWVLLNCSEFRFNH